MLREEYMQGLEGPVVRWRMVQTNAAWIVFARQSGVFPENEVSAQLGLV